MPLVPLWPQFDKGHSRLIGANFWAFLFNDHESFLQPFVNILQDNGVPRSHIATLIYNWPMSTHVCLDHFIKSRETMSDGNESIDQIWKGEEGWYL